MPSTNLIGRAVPKWFDSYSCCQPVMLNRCCLTFIPPLLRPPSLHHISSDPSAAYVPAWLFTTPAIFFLCWRYCNYAVANRLLATCWQPFFFSIISPKKIQSLFCVNLASGHCCPDTFVADSHYPPLMRASFHLFCTQDHSRWSPVAVAASLGMDHFPQWSMLRWLLVSVPQGNDWFE